MTATAPAAPRPRAPKQAAWADARTLDAVRPPVRDILMSSRAFRQLSPEEQRELAGTMVKVAAYMSNPDGVTRDAIENPSAPVATAQEKTSSTQPQPTARAMAEFANKEFVAGGVKQGVEQFGALVKKVDFPKFVSGLIQGVFKAIVDSSLEQMRAYGELLANVAKTVDQFARDNISDNNTRDWLVQSYPGELAIDHTTTSSGFGDDAAPPVPAPKLKTTAEDATATYAKINSTYKFEKPITDLSEEVQEQMLVQAAKLEIARGRQQLLASMVILGINRIVVTDGLIHAKVVFDVTASDQAKRVATASSYDETDIHAGTKTSAGYGAWFSPVKASFEAEASTDHKTLVQSALDETSESKADVKAKLTGEVRVNFKSDYFPMEKMASPQMIAAIQGNAVPPEKPVEGA